MAHDENTGNTQSKIMENPTGYNATTMTLNDPMLRSIFAGVSMVASLLLGCGFAFFKTPRAAPQTTTKWVASVVCGYVLMKLIAVRITRKIAKGTVLSEDMIKNTNLKEKFVVLTGGTAGIGKATAIQLLKWGAKVCIGARPAKAAAAKAEIMKAANLEDGSNRLQIITLDLSDLKSVKSFAKAVLNLNEGIDILINNAGVMIPQKFELTKDGFEQLVGCNHIAHFLLTNLLLDNIKKQHGRIITVASLAHAVPGFMKDIGWSSALNPIEKNYKPYHYYGISKLFNIWFTRELQKKLDADSSTTATAYCNHPGVVQTELFRNAPAAARAIYGIIGVVMKTAEAGAATQLYLAAAPKEELQPGLYYDNCKLGTVAPYVKDPKKSKELWDRTMEAVEKFLN